MAVSFLYVLDEEKLNRKPQEYAKFVDLLTKRGYVDFGTKEFNKSDLSTGNDTDYETYLVLVGPIYHWNNRIRIDTAKYRLFGASERQDFDPKHIIDGFTSVKYRGKIRRS